MVGTSQSQTWKPRMRRAAPARAMPAARSGSPGGSSRWRRCGRGRGRGRAGRRCRAPGPGVEAGARRPGQGSRRSWPTAGRARGAAERPDPAGGRLRVPQPGDAAHHHDEAGHRGGRTLMGALSRLAEPAGVVADGAAAVAGREAGVRMWRRWPPVRPDVAAPGADGGSRSEQRRRSRSRSARGARAGGVQAAEPAIGEVAERLRHAPLRPRRRGGRGAGACGGRRGAGRAAGRPGRRGGRCRRSRARGASPAGRRAW